ncbi:MAG: hypothetical protein IJ465_01135 [Clostridia bacterium]|nr:hypothetical protein [Clostridia bacterium]
MKKYYNEPSIELMRLQQAAVYTLSYTDSEDENPGLDWDVDLTSDFYVG